MEDLQLIKSIAEEINRPLSEVEEKKFSISTFGFTQKNGKVTGLNIYNLELTKIPDKVFELKSLQKFFASYNYITQIPEKLFTLSQLEYINLAYNKITEIPIGTRKLVALISFDLSHNKITGISPDILDIATEIKYERESIFSLKRVSRGLNLYKNPLEMPPIEVIKRGKLSIFRYFRYVKEEPTTLLNEAKLLIVGEGSVGKTTLMKALMDEDIEKAEATTEGIDIKRWPIQTADGHPFRVNLWDFGGQEIYHATHQFFLTKRSLYLFVWEARKDENITAFDYWLNVIKLLSDSAPVIVIQNKIDERTKQIDSNLIKKKFDNIIAFENVSALTNEGIPELKNRIKKEILNLYHIGDVLPLSWKKIRTELEILNTNYITFEQYLAICKNNNLDSEVASYLSNYLHDLGVFLHFEDNAVLKDIIFLRPKWVTSAVYKVHDSKQAAASFGALTMSDFRDIWKDYPVERHIELLELLKKFELCLHIPNTGTYIIPELLPANMPEVEWNYSNNLRFVYQYDFMPSGIITRLIVKTNDLNQERIFWKNGLVIQLDDSKALIIGDSFARKIFIWLTGNEKSELLTIIRRELAIIHASINNPDVHEMIACICSECEKSETPFLHEYHYLERLQEKGKLETTCQNSLEEVPIQKLIGDVDTKVSKEIIKDKKRLNAFTTIIGGAIFLVSILGITLPGSFLPDYVSYVLLIAIVFIFVFLFTPKKVQK